MLDKMGFCPFFIQQILAELLSEEALEAPIGEWVDVFSHKFTYIKLFSHYCEVLAKLRFYFRIAKEMTMFLP